jgi:hypothetical protein
MTIESKTTRTSFIDKMQFSTGRDELSDYLVNGLWGVVDRPIEPHFSLRTIISERDRN